MTKGRKTTYGHTFTSREQLISTIESYIDYYGNAANTVVFPLTVVALGIAVLIGDGCCAFVSIALGSSAREDAHRAVGNAVVLCMAASLVLTACLPDLPEPILALFGGTRQRRDLRHSQEYFFYITLGIPFYMFGQAMNPIIRADGSPRFAMVSTVCRRRRSTSFWIPVFIFGFRWGMMGAAVATVIGQVVTAALAVWYLLHMKIIQPGSGLTFRLKGSPSAAAS